MKNTTELTNAITTLLDMIDDDQHSFNHQLQTIKWLKVELDILGMERFSVCYLGTFEYAVYDKVTDLYVDRRGAPSGATYFTEEEAKAIANHLNRKTI